MNTCVFCSIVNHEIPTWVIYQDQEVICFLPNPPEVYGHTLIAPKQHIVDIYTAPESVLASMMAVSKKLAVHYKTQISASGINLLHASGVSAQQSVFHFHLHLFPRFDNDGLNTWPQLPDSSFDKDEMHKNLKL